MIASCPSKTVVGSIVKGTELLSKSKAKALPVKGVGSAGGGGMALFPCTQESESHRNSTSGAQRLIFRSTKPSTSVIALVIRNGTRMAKYSPIGTGRLACSARVLLPGSERDSGAKVRPAAPVVT